MKNIIVFIIVAVIIFITNFIVFYLLKKTQRQEIKELIKEEIGEHLILYPHFDIKTLDHCESCGCLIAPGEGISGKGEIRLRNFSEINGYIPTEYIHYPYYCKICAPKVVKK